MPGDETAQPLTGVAFCGRRLCGGCLKERGAALDNFDEQLLLSDNMRVERRAEQPELGAEVPHRGAVIAAFGEEPSCGRDDILPGAPSHR